VQVGSKERIGDVWFFSANTYSNGGGYGLIYKNGEAHYEPQKYPKDEIVYIPEYGFPEREYDQVHEGDLISKYTRQDLIDITCSETLASELFDELTWQHPESLWNEWCSDSDKNGYWIEAQWAYEKVYLPEFATDVDRHGQEPVCSEEFRDNEWGDKECRSYFLRRLVDMALVSKEDMDKIMKNMEAEIV
jgi:hypothetical protein